jgi:uncharacterized protein YodC (DUF2158 family)
MPAKVVFETGQIVTLKSGGPQMTVQTSSAKDGYSHCQWFAGKKLEQGRFPAESMKLVEPEVN